MFAVFLPGPTPHQVDRGWEGFGVEDGSLGRQGPGVVVSPAHVIVLDAQGLVRVLKAAIVWVMIQSLPWATVK
jgi:hypothetical protein